MSRALWSSSVALTATELRRIVADRTALFFMLALPVIIMIIIGGTVFAEAEGAARLGVLVEDEGPLADDLATELLGSADLDVEQISDREELIRQVRLGRLDGGVIIAEGTAARLARGDSAELALVAVPDAGGAARVRSRVDEVAIERSRQVAVERLAEELGTNPDQAVAALDGLEESVIEVSEISVSATDSETNQYSYTAAANLVLFVFINSLTAGSVLAQGRASGVFRRALSAPTTTTALVAGVGVSRLVFALIQSVLLVAVSVLLFDVGFGDPVAATALIVAMALVSSAAGVAIGAVTRSVDTATAVANPVGIGMAMLGGCMWPLEVVGDTMRTVGHLTPHAWAMDGWIELVFDGQGLGAIVGELAVLAAFGLTLGVIAVVSLRRSLAH